MSELNTFQKWCKEILPIVQAAANGMDVQCQNLRGGVGWYTKSYPDLSGVYEYRIKPHTITVNGFEVPEPIREKPSEGDEYFLSVPLDYDMFSAVDWYNDEEHNRWLSRGLCHATKEAAIAHAKAMLGIDPNQPEE